jgi:hypothetical protein
MTSEPQRGQIRVESDRTMSIYSGNRWIPLAARNGFSSVVQVEDHIRRNGERIVELQREETTTGQLIKIKSVTPFGAVIHRTLTEVAGGFVSSTGEITLTNENNRLNIDPRDLVDDEDELDIMSSAGTSTSARISTQFLVSSTSSFIPSIISDPDSYIREHMGRYTQRKSFSGIFECEKGDGELREFKPGNGLFHKGIKKFLALPIEEQNIKIRQLEMVKSYNEFDKAAKIDLGWAGIYEVWIKREPKGERIEKFGKRSDRNPFLSQTGLCLGNMKTTYARCFENGNYLECIKVVGAVLCSKLDSHGYKRWSDCK